MTVTSGNGAGFEDRVLVFMPTGRDAELVCATLGRAGLAAHRCADIEGLVAAISVGAGAILITEEALHENGASKLTEKLEAQSIWSDLPVIVFSSHTRNAETLLHTLGGRINATVVERPIRVTMLVSAVRAALRARQRQYQTRDLLRRLEESDKQKDLFLATLSHELRTPLNSMLGWLQVLRNRDSGNVDLEHALEVIERNARAQSEMVSDILFISQVVTGKLELKQVSVNVTSVIRSAIDIMLPASDAKNVEIVLQSDTDEDLWMVADPYRLRQIFLNLISNAVKFTPAHGRIKVEVGRSAENVAISVRDSGAGIDPKVLPFIFEKFRQADNSFTRQVGGLGLGLAIVRHLVELHQGSVRAESDGPNKGANFVVTFPLCASQGVNDSEGIDAHAIAHEKQDNLLLGVRVLLVEDDPDSSEMLTLVLNHSGAEVATAQSVAGALEKMHEFRPQVLVSDIGLPLEDGYDLIRRVRDLPPDNGGSIPAVALTGYASLKDRTTALEAGFQEHLPKPVDTERLVELIAGFLPHSVGQSSNR